MSGNSSGGAHSRPVRIELATSEIEGSRCIGWADPSQVLAVVAISEPHDAFARHLEPVLVEGPSAGEGVDGPPSSETPTGTGGGLPPALQGLIERLRAVHRRLHRENQSLMRDPRWVSLTCAFAEENRVYFVKGAPSRVFLLRDGKAYQAEQEGGNAGASAALGRQETLRLEVTSLPVQPGDTVVLLASENDVPPDLRALTSVFDQTNDLKRACDGLVNLLGLQSEGASAVALRFLAIGTNGAGRENPLDDLARDLLVKADAPLPADCQGETVCADIGEEPAGQDQGELLPDGRGSDYPGAAQELVPGGEVRGPCLEDHPQGVADRERGLCHLGVRRDSVTCPTTRRETGVFWPVLIILLVAGLALLAAIPLRHGTPPIGARLYHWIQEQDIRSWIGSRGGIADAGPAGTSRGVGFGSLNVAPDPPARSVLIDGEVKASGTPVRLEMIPAGRHRIGLDLGPCGIWETELHVPRGETASLTPRLVGSVEIMTADPRLKGFVWTPGRDKVSTPARIDSLPVGWNRVFYEDERLPMWDRNVLVRAGETARVVVPNDFASDQGLVRISAMVFRQGDGLVDAVGDSVWVDGSFVGLTPMEKGLSPGLHSVRVGSAAHGQYSEVLEVRAGATRHVQGRLSSSPRPVIVHNAPGRVWIRGPVLLSAEISGGAGSVRPTLHLPELPSGLRQIPMTPVDQGAGVYVGVVEPEALPAGRTVSYYFTIQGSNGETVWSDLFRLECLEETPND